MATAFVPSGMSTLVIAAMLWTAARGLLNCRRGSSIEAAPRRERSRVAMPVQLWRVAVVASGLLLYGCGGSGGGSTPSPVAVPNVVGMTQAAASTTITGAGLTVGTVSMTSSATVASGDVISESPAAGTSAASNSAVSLTVSSGPAPVPVPNVVGMTQAAASTAITGAGLTVGTVTMASSATVASGNVISENPAAGTNAALGSAVSLTVSTGPAVAQVNGKDFDGPVVGATINAYTVSSTGVLGTTPIATAITDSTGSYSLSLPAGFSSTVELQSIGGQFTDDTTGLPVAALSLSALVPNASGTIAAQLTPLSTIVEQVSVQLAQAAGVDPGTIATTLNAALGNYFGGQTNLQGTPLVDVTTAGCNTTASQASVDASLLVAALSQIANNNGVTTTSLVNALVWDYVSDLTFDGDDNGSPILVPLTNGNGSVLLCTIEGDCAGSTGGGFQQVIAAAVTQFTSSGANGCGVSLSASAMSSLTTPSAAVASPPAPGVVAFSVSGTINGLPPSSSLVLDLGGGGIGRCTTSNDCIVVTYQLSQGSGSGAVQFSVTGGSPVSGFTDWILLISNHGYANGSDTLCTLASADTGGIAPNATSVSITGIVINCAPRVYPISGTICCVLAGTTVVLQDELTDNLSITAPSTGSLSGFFTFPTQLTKGSAYSATVLTQPASGGPCVVGGGDNGMGGGTLHVGTGAELYSVQATNITVTCGTPTPPVLNNPNGLALQNNLLYVANAGGNQVLIFSENLTGVNVVTGLTLLGTITQDINNPTRLAFDASGRYLFVTNLAPGNGSVTVYDTANSNQEVIARKITGGSIDRPLGIAVDTAGNVYVAENSGNSISVFQPNNAGGYTEASFSPISADAGGNSFFAPGAMALYPNGYDSQLLLIGTGAGNELVYQAPFTNTSTALIKLSDSGCSTAPTGPTAFAFKVGVIPQGAQSDATLWIADFYGNDVVGYNFGTWFSSSCPAPMAAISTAAGASAHPEGLVYDNYGNIIVSNSSTNHLTVYGQAGLGAPPVFIY